jgi:hypothetical protein
MLVAIHKTACYSNSKNSKLSIHCREYETNRAKYGDYLATLLEISRNNLFERLEVDAAGAQICTFKLFTKLRSETSDKARSGLISEEQLQQYNRNVTVTEEEFFKS